MIDKLNLAVREIQKKDIDLIADYWLKSESDFLIQMGVDLNKIPTRVDLRLMLTEQINTSLLDKNSYALIWEFYDKQIGHTNVNNIEYGKIATMHLHLWNSTTRNKGIGTELIRMSLPFYFKRLKIKKLICEPYALNSAPNKTLKKVGFKFVKKYLTTPGALNFEQVVNRWELTQERFISIYDRTMNHSL